MRIVEEVMDWKFALTKGRPYRDIFTPFCPTIKPSIELFSAFPFLRLLEVHEYSVDP